jgi:phosphoglycerate dehydrogenase-like enzyme
MRVAILDDWQNVAETLVDWAPIKARAEVVFYREPFASADAAATALADFDIVLTLRERTPFPTELVARLPRLRMFGMTGKRAKAIDLKCLIERGVTVCYTGGGETGTDTAELTLGLIMAAARHIPAGDAAMRSGGFTGSVPPGLGLAGRTLGLVGLGRIGSLVAGYANALGMNVIAWSRNLTPERAARAGATQVSREEVFSKADVVSIHIYLTKETEGLVSAADIARMKHGAILVNTSRSRLVDQAALLEAARQSRIRIALDVYDTEPPLPGDPLRTAPNSVLTPHLGYLTGEVLEAYYGQTVENTLAYIEGRPIRTLSLADLQP